LVAQIAIAVVIGVVGALALAWLWRVVYVKRAQAILDEPKRNSDRLIEDARKQA